MTDSLTARLRALPHPAPPRDLTFDVLARVDALEQARRIAPVVPSRLIPLQTVGCAVAVPLIVGALAAGNVPLLHLVPFSAGELEGPTSGIAAVSLLAGLALYAAALVAPLRRFRPSAR